MTVDTFTWFFQQVNNINFLLIKKSWKYISVFPQTIISINQHIRKRSCDTEDWSDGCWKNNLSLIGINYTFKYSKTENVSGYVCNHGSPNGERDTASPRGRYGERPQRDSVWRYIWKNTTCWPATAHDVTTGVPQYKCRREDTSSASSSEACVRSMVQSLGDAVSRSPFGEPWLHT